MGRAGETILLAGGGTGGHLFPGLAVWEELSGREPSRRLVVVGTGRPVERHAAERHHFELEVIHARALKGTGLASRVLSLASLPLATAQATRLIRSIRPAVVIGLGGYVSGPVVVAARALGVPTALMEQNSHPGFSNRLLGRLKAVRRAYLTFPSSASFFASDAARVLGNPVRSSIMAARGAAMPQKASVFVLGGSQGARTLNLALPGALADVSQVVANLSILHQTGEAMAEEVRARYDEYGLEARVEPFIDDMAAAYSEASLVVCRAGATTLAELTTVGRPSVLVPYPHAIDDHQTKNARELEEAGAAILVADSRATEARLGPTLADLMTDPERLNQMGACALDLGAPEAARQVADDLEEIIRVWR